MRGRKFNDPTVSLCAQSIVTSYPQINIELRSIILRAFQGVGASGIYSMVLVVAPTLIPREKSGKYVGIISSVFAIASVLGPVLGGVITTNSTWRWVFLLK